MVLSKNVLLAAATAVAVGQVNASVGSLRSSILSSMKVQSGPPNLPPECKGIVGTPSDQDRYCEVTETDVVRDNCACREQCHIWGDPHVEPFFTGCDLLTLKMEGWYSLLSVPGLRIDGYSEAITNQEGKHWISKLMINGDMKLTATECIEDLTIRRVLGPYKLSPAGYANDIEVEVEVYCDKNGGKPTHVNTIINVLDSCNENGAGISSQGDDGSESEVPVSMAMFPSAAGVCINPCNNDVSFLGNEDKPKKNETRSMKMDADGKYECKTQSGNKWFWEQNFGTGKCKKREGGIDGRECSAKAQCAVHGDPYLVDFYRDMIKNEAGCSTKGGRKSECFNIYPRDPTSSDSIEVQEALQAREYYMIPGQYQATLATDECELITEYRVTYIPKNKPVSAVYHAHEICSKHDPGNLPAGSLGYTISAPGDPANSFNEEIRRADQAVWNSDVRGFLLASDSIKSDDGIKTEPGYITANLKCHKTKPKGNREASYYFNVCLERRGAKQFEGDSQKAVIDMEQVELKLNSRGHCATGNVLNQQVIRGEDVIFSFEQRSVVQVPQFDEIQCLGSTC